MKKNRTGAKNAYDTKVSFILILFIFTMNPPSFNIFDKNTPFPILTRLTTEKGADIELTYFLLIV